ncbi:MAG: FtsX-like permease family protein [Gammaproteobacteria bacterium]|nr:FtsX-like permease family protein [Gammaproteobacteria bacterium]
MPDFKIALRLFARDWRSGELRILMVSLLIAISGLTTIAVIVDRVDRGMSKETSQILGADRVIRSPRPILDATLKEISALGLNRSDSIRFRTMVIAGNEFQLASVRAVDLSYPLAGELRISDTPFVQGKPAKGAPTTGNVWVSPRLLQALNISINNQVEIGVQRFTISGIIETEPGNTDFISFAPSLIMALSDVPATKVIQPGSRVAYHYDFSGSEAALLQFDQWCKTALSASERVIGAEENSPTVQSALGRARNYLNLAGLLGLLLGSVAIAIVSNRYVRRHFDHAALLRCIGMKQNHILYIYSLVLLFAALIGTTLGIILGYFLQQTAITALADWLPEKIPSANSGAVGLGYIAGVLVVAGFSLPGLLRIRRVTPMRILRNDLVPLPVSAWISIFSAITALGLVMWRYTLDIKLVSVVLLGGILLTAVLSAFTRLLLRFLRKVSRSVAMPVRFGTGHLLRHREATLIQTAAFSIILTLMLTILLVRNELISDWQKQLPPETPNHFVINLPPADTQAFREFLLTHSITPGEIYPMVRGRIVEINDKSVAQVFGEHYGQQHNSLRRELNLTWSTTLPKSNQILQGGWQTSNKNGISIEQEMADSLNLQLNDTLTFNIGSLTTKGTITSIRKVEWDSFEPNFYVIFQPGKLESFGATYISSFYLPLEQKIILNGMLQKFSSISILETDRILQQVRNIIRQASIAVEFVLIFVIAAGLIVLLSTTYASLDEKEYEAGVLRTLGARNRTIFLCIISEYWLLAMLAGIMATFASESIAFGLYYFVFKIDPVLHGWLWWLSPIAAILLIVPAGVFGVRSIVSTQPVRILNKN